jgi:hypothetical protein
MEYRPVALGEVLKQDDEWRFNFSNDWYPISKGFFGKKYLNRLIEVRRPTSTKVTNTEEYRSLETGDVIQEGDEYYNNESWNIIHSWYVGDKYNNRLIVPMRRKITKREESMKEKFIIGSISKVSGEFSISKKPAIHDNFLTAQRECERLSRIHTDKQFVCFQIKGICQAVQISWE